MLGDASMMGQETMPADAAAEVARTLSQFRAMDGGFHLNRAASRSTVYACFLGLAAYYDLRIALPEADRLADALMGLRTNDGAGRMSLEFRWARRMPRRRR
jgi:hypothetical protein